MTDGELALAAFRRYPGPVGVLDAEGRLRTANRAWSAPASPIGALVGRTVTPGEDLRALLAEASAPGARETGAALASVLDHERRDAEIVVTVTDPEGHDVLHRIRISVNRPGFESMLLFTIHEMGPAGDPRTPPRDEALDPLTESPDDVFWIQSPDRRVLHYLSPAFEEVYGRAREDALADPGLLLEAVHPLDRERVRSNLWRQMDGSWNEEYRLVRPDGTERWVHSRAFAVRDDSGAIIKVMGITTDVTERHHVSDALRRSEARYRAIFQSSPVGMALLGPAGEILEANPALLTLLGWERIADRTALDLFGSEERAQVTDLLERAGGPGAVSWTRETRFTGERDEPRSVRVQISPAAFGDGHGQALLLVENISDRRRLEAQLRQAQRIESVGRLAGGIAHDFNNLVTVIRGHTDLILDGLSGDDPLRADLTDIRDAGERVAALTSQLLAFSRRNVLQPRVVNLNAVVEGVRVILRRALGEDVTFDFHPSDDLGLVRADPHQLEQILLNIAINARDAMPRGGHFSIRTFDRELGPEFVQSHLGSLPGPHVAISFEDTGQGMDKETLSLIFEPFFTTKEPGKGTGLGLAMAYGIVKQSGGYIDVESAPGEGTTFTIYLPRVEAEDPEPAPDLSAEGAAIGSETVLVVEDEAQVRSLTARVLESRGYAVLSAEDGRDALVRSRAHAKTIDLVITDVVMPGMGGSELAERLQAERPGIRVLFTSGYADDAVVRHGVFRREMPFLAKPFTPSELAARVRRVLDEDA